MLLTDSSNASAVPPNWCMTDGDNILAARPLTDVVASPREADRSDLLPKARYRAIDRR